MWLLVKLTLPKGLVEEARAHDETMKSDEHAHDHNNGGSHEHSQHGGHEHKSRLQRIADAFAMDWSMLWKELVTGFLIAGFVAVLVPPSVWRALFLTGHAASGLKLVENALVGPLIAVASFVCSVGNIPLASILWSGGISFGGVISFIYADLIVLPLIVIYARYYGWRASLYITAVMYISMVSAGIVVDLAFSGMHLVPTGPRPLSAIMNAHFAWNYSTWLNIPAVVIAAALAAVHKRTAQTTTS